MQCPMRLKKCKKHIPRLASVYGQQMNIYTKYPRTIREYQHRTIDAIDVNNFTKIGYIYSAAKHPKIFKNKHFKNYAQLSMN